MGIILYLYQSAFAQSQQLKHQSNVGNLFKVNNKDTRATSSRHLLFQSEQWKHQNNV